MQVRAGEVPCKLGPHSLACCCAVLCCVAFCRRLPWPSTLLGHPLRPPAEAAVIAIPDEKWSERPLLLVVAKAGQVSGRRVAMEPIDVEGIYAAAGAGGSSTSLLPPTPTPTPAGADERVHPGLPRGQAGQVVAALGRRLCQRWAGGGSGGRRAEGGTVVRQRVCCRFYPLLSWLPRPYCRDPPHRDGQDQQADAAPAVQGLPALRLRRRRQPLPLVTQAAACLPFLHCLLSYLEILLCNQPAT